MTREEIYAQCVEKIAKTNCLLLEAATGTGKSKVSIDLVNRLCTTIYKGKKVKMLLLVDRKVHKITWKEEIRKWKGLEVTQLDMACYASLGKFYNKHYDVIVADEAHHIGSELKLGQLKDVHFDYFIGLSATIPRKTKMYFKYHYHAEFVTCDIIEAIEDGILPEPMILLFPLILDNRNATESWEFFKDAPGPVVHAEYKDIRKYKFNKRIHSIISMTQKQKCLEFDNLISFFKRNNREQAKLYMSGRRLEFLADIKLPIIRDILAHLDKERTITFCKSIKQAEAAGQWCIHSKNDNATKYYEDFNNKKIDHITAVNILNENANLVDCKYAIFCNLSSSEISVPQRIGRSLRHKSPVIIVPYYEGTREEELALAMVEGFNKERIKTIHSIFEII